MIYEGMRIRLNMAVELQLAPTTSPVTVRMSTPEEALVRRRPGKEPDDRVHLLLYSKEPFFAIMVARHTGQAVHPGLLESKPMNVQQERNNGGGN